MIHPSAIVHPEARVADDVQVGPFAVIDGNVEIGPGCVVGPHVHLTGHTTIGAGNRFHAGCVIGDAPQDFKYAGAPTRLRIGDGNTFREHVTVHRSNREDEDTVLGSRNFLMAHSHVGHNCLMHNDVILANGALLGGHVEVADRVFVSGNCLVHQFVRIGTLALMQGGAAISQDLPPYCIATGDNGLCGLNVVGLRRAGIPAGDRAELKRLYHRLFRSDKNLSAALASESAPDAEPCPAARALLAFLASSKRGVCRHTTRR
jgi:UDP-N-acetylglucosamine acyltransferase